MAVDSPLTDSHSLRNKLRNPEALDESHRASAQHIEAIQRRRKITFDKRQKIPTLRLGMMVLFQNAQKLDLLSKFDVV